MSRGVAHEGEEVTHTVIVGGGYAGVMAANRLAGQGIEVSLVTQDPHFVERVRLHQVAAGARESARAEFVQLLNPLVNLVIARAELCGPLAPRANS